MDLLHQSYYISDKFVYSDNEQVTVAQCYNLANHSPTERLDWDTTHQSYPTKYPILDIIQAHGHNTIPTSSTASIKPTYKELIICWYLHIIGKRMVYLKPILTNKKFLSLIVVPWIIQKEIFDNYHAGSSIYHTVEYKTLYRICNRFLWGSILDTINKWTFVCAHCVSYNMWRNQKSKLYLYWSETVPFWITYVYLWFPVHVVTNKKGANFFIINCLCDIT